MPIFQEPFRRALKVTGAVLAPAVLIAGCSGTRDRPGPGTSRSAPGASAYGAKKTLFDATTPPQGMEIYETGVLTTGGGSYRRENIVHANGTLSVVAEQDPHREPPTGVTKHRNSFFGAAQFEDFTYGKLTVDARLPEFDAFKAGNQIGKPLLILWPSIDKRWLQDVEVDFLEASKDAATRGYITQWINAADPTSPNTPSPSRPRNEAIPMDSGWHTYTLDWQPNKLELRVDGEVTLATTDSRFVPKGQHHLVLQVDALSIPDRPVNAVHKQVSLEVRRITLEPYILERTPKPTVPRPEVVSSRDVFSAGNNMFVIARNNILYPSRDGKTPANDLAIVAVPSNGGAMLKDNNVLDPITAARTAVDSLLGRGYTEGAISSKGTRWFAVITADGSQSDFFSAKAQGTGVLLKPEQSNLKPAVIGM